MNRLINCDDVFDILTRAPFPAGEATDATVEGHLRACHECRELAEALRPAVDLFHESIPSDESFDLPGYMGTLFAAVDEVAVDEAAATTLVQTQPVPRRRLKNDIASSTLGMVVCLFICCGLMFSFGRDLTPTLTFGTPSSDIVIRPNRLGLALLASLNLPPVCRDTFVEQAKMQAEVMDPQPVLDARNKTRCCTECHATANPRRPRLTSTVRLTSSCGACHDDQASRASEHAALQHDESVPSVAWWTDLIARLASRNHGTNVSPSFVPPVDYVVVACGDPWRVSDEAAESPARQHHHKPLGHPVFVGSRQHHGSASKAARSIVFRRNLMSIECDSSVCGTNGETRFQGAIAAAYCPDAPARSPFRPVLG